MRYHQGERVDIRLQHDDDAGGECGAVPDDELEDIRLCVHPLGGRGRDADALRVDHLAHYAAGGVGDRDQHRVQVQLQGGDLLQAAEEGVAGRVRAGEE